MAGLEGEAQVTRRASGCRSKDQAIALHTVRKQQMWLGPQLPGGGGRGHHQAPWPTSLKAAGTLCLMAPVLTRNENQSFSSSDDGQPSLVTALKKIPSQPLCPKPWCLSCHVPLVLVSKLLLNTEACIFSI